MISSAAAWFENSGVGWLVSAIALAAIIGFTLLGIFPTNKRLLDSSLAADFPEATELLVRWVRLHAARTALGLAALAACLISI